MLMMMIDHYVHLPVHHLLLLLPCQTNEYRVEYTHHHRHHRFMLLLCLTGQILCTQYSLWYLHLFKCKEKTGTLKKVWESSTYVSVYLKNIVSFNPIENLHIVAKKSYNILIYASTRQGFYTFSHQMYGTVRWYWKILNFLTEFRYIQLAVMPAWKWNDWLDTHTR